jgi:hypothetical protein
LYSTAVRFFESRSNDKTTTTIEMDEAAPAAATVADAVEYDEDHDEEDPKAPIGDVDLEIVGLESGSNGRSCCLHA